MSFIDKYLPYFPLCFNIIFPVAGILFFGWSVGDIFLLFFVELFFLCGATAIKMLTAVSDGSIMRRIYKIFGFFIGFFIVFFLMVILAGNFFNGAEKQMDLTITRTTIYVLGISYLFSFLGGYVLSGKYKRVKCDTIRDETIKYIGCLLLILAVILIPFGELMKNHVISYALGISIVMTRNIVDFFIVNRQERKLKKGT